MRAVIVLRSLFGLKTDCPTCVIPAKAGTRQHDPSGKVGDLGPAFAGMTIYLMTDYYMRKADVEVIPPGEESSLYTRSSRERTGTV
jgi:hypothetical protein